MTKALIAEDKVLPISLKVLITIIAGGVAAILYFANIDAKFTVYDAKLSAQDVKFTAQAAEISAVKIHQDKQDNAFIYLQILVVRIADKLNVDTSNPLDKGASIKNLNSNIYLPL